MTIIVYIESNFLPCLYTSLMCYTSHKYAQMYIGMQWYSQVYRHISAYIGICGHTCRYMYTYLGEYIYICSIMYYDNINKDTITLSYVLLYYCIVIHSYSIPALYLLVPGLAMYPPQVVSCIWPYTILTNSGRSDFNLLNVDRHSLQRYIYVSMENRKTCKSWFKGHQWSSTK